MNLLLVLLFFPIGSSILSIELQLQRFYEKGIYGEGERICVLDSGFTKTSLFHSQYEVETLSFTDQSSSRNDLLNHGTASVSILINQNKDCPGIIPQARVFALKVVDDEEDIQTSSLCQALRSVRSLHCSIAVLPFGGRDMDELVLQQAIADVINAGVTVIAAAGNDGPAFGSVLSPADQPGVISVGSLHSFTQFLSSSARGHRTHTRPRLLPEFASLAHRIPVSDAQGRITRVSGTSVAAPILGGVVGLLRQELRLQGISPSPGLLHCLLAEHSRVVGGQVYIPGGWTSSNMGGKRERDGKDGRKEMRKMCVIPSEVRIPSDSFPFILNSL